MAFQPTPTLAAEPVCIDQFGDVLSREDVMRLFQIPSPHALYRRLQGGSLPAPAMTRPMRWFKADLRRLLNGDSRPTAFRRRA